jgi:hypothetical protein
MTEVPNFVGGERSLLRIEPIGIPPYSVRGVRQSLATQQADITYDWNGRALNFTPPQFLGLYTSTISCRDTDVPAIDGVLPGDEMLVYCVHELRGRLGTDAEPAKPMVDGSYHEEGGFYYYRPILNMVFLGFTSQIAEWEGNVAWAFDLREVNVEETTS